MAENPTPQDDTTEKRAPANGAAAMGPEIGYTGLKENAGYVNEDFLPELRTHQKRIKTYREMSSNDPIVGAILFAAVLICRSAKWEFTPADDSGTAKNEAAFVESIFDDMSHTKEDFLSEVLSFMVYGWSYHETVYKRRVGPDETDPAARSKYTDGRIGIRKLPIRSQDSLQKWEMQDDGGIAGMHQMPVLGGAGDVFIPIERAVLFRTTSRKNSPEGVSVLRTAYRAWYFQHKIQELEAIGIERELAGLPVVSIPSEYLAANAPAEKQAVRVKFESLARDIKRNEQGGILIQSDVYKNDDGTLSAIPMVSIKLLTSGGARQIDTNIVVKRYEADVARSVLADFIMIGSEAHGSFALSKNKTDLFLKAIEAFLAQIAAPLNMFVLPRLWAINGLPRETMPSIGFIRIAPDDIAALGAYIRDLAGAGMPLFPDPDLEASLRDAGDLPEKSEEAQAMQDQAAQDARDAAAAAAAAISGTGTSGAGGGNPPGGGSGTGDETAGGGAA